MNKEELEKKLQRLKDELEDVEQERHFMLEKTKIHVPGHLKRSYEEKINELKENIQQIEEQLNNAS